MSKLIAGIDEVGRGPLVGAVVAAAVILDPDKPIEGLADSKKLTEKMPVSRFCIKNVFIIFGTGYLATQSSVRRVWSVTFEESLNECVIP